MTEQQLTRYADLLLWCIGGIDGRKLVILCEPVQRDLVVTIAQRAYKQGATLVDIVYDEPLAKRARVDFASQENLVLFPAYAADRYKEHARNDWSLVSLRGPSEPDYLDGADTTRVAEFSKAQRELSMPLSLPVTQFKKHWVGAIYPTRALALKACPGLEPDEALERYEREVIRVLGLDAADTVSDWQQRITELNKRRDWLSSLELDSIHLAGPGTDLRIGMPTGGRWGTAGATMEDGRPVFVNMPSLEVFTTPDWRRTEGTVRATRPYLSTSSPGNLISGAWFEFRDGAVVRFGAEEGESILSSVLEMDDRACFLGEIALVDSESAVAQAGFTFYNTLYDENAATHMAIGRGFPRFLDGAESMSPEQLIEAGVNYSLVHDDIMIGSPAINVDGITVSGETVSIMKKGRFVR